MGNEAKAMATVLASLAKRSCTEAIVALDGAVAWLVAEMWRSTEWSWECVVCRRWVAAANTEQGTIECPTSGDTSALMMAS